MEDIWIEHNQRLYNLKTCYLVLSETVDGEPGILLFTQDYNSILKFEDKNDRNDYFDFVKSLLMDEECDNIV